MPLISGIMLLIEKAMQLIAVQALIDRRIDNLMLRAMPSAAGPHCREEGFVMVAVLC